MNTSENKGFWRKFRDLVAFAMDLPVSVNAAHVSFFLILAVFPLLVLLLSVLRYAGLDASGLTQLLRGVFPEALFPIVERLILSAYRSTSGAVVSVSVITALWSSSRGMYSLITGLNDIYGVAENRGYWRTRLMSMLYTFGFVAVLLLTLILNVMGPAFLEELSGRGFLWQMLAEVVGMRNVLLLVLQTGLFAGMFMVLPNRRNRFSDSLPGAVLSAVGWQLFSNLYSVYVEQFVRYTNIYGSVYAVALSMLWLYCCISIVFYGAVLNRYLADSRP